jgi:hypothetical protein
LNHKTCIDWLTVVIDELHASIDEDWEPHPVLLAMLVERVRDEIKADRRARKPSRL